VPSHEAAAEIKGSEVQGQSTLDHSTLQVGLWAQLRTQLLQAAVLFAVLVFVMWFQVRSPLFSNVLSSCLLASVL
jgi:hypothetical protein